MNSEQVRTQDIDARIRQELGEDMTKLAGTVVLRKLIRHFMEEFPVRMKPALMEFKGGPAAAADLFEDVINTSLKVAVEALAMEINPEVASRMIAQRVLGKAQQDG